MNYFRNLLSFLILGFMIQPSLTFAIPVNNDIALTVFKGQVLVREQVIYHRHSGDPSSTNEEENRLEIPSILAYGLTQDLTVQLTIPYVLREFEQTIGEERVTRKTSGLGDLTLLSKYEFYEKDGLGETSNASILGGIEIPTGDFNDDDRFGRFARDLQVGKGSWNPILALAYNWETFRHEFDASVSYTFNTEGHDYEFGDTLHHNLSYQFRIWPWELKSGKGIPSYFLLGVELNGMWHQKDQEDGRILDNTGRYVLFASPTLQFISKRFIWESSIQLPIIQNTFGEQNETDLIVRTGIRFNF